MKLLIVRHGIPNYELDELTEEGWKEAQLLAEKLSKLDIKDFYVSPLGRAQNTARCTLEKMNRTATTCEWLREFAPQIMRPDVTEHKMIAWDWLPEDWLPEEKYADVNAWLDTDIMEQSDVREQYEWVCKEFDQVLAKHGYERSEKNYYNVRKANNDTIVFFCHFGVECVLLSHILHISPMSLWHGFCASTTSVTTVYTEERRKGIASFRVAEFGSTEHLYVAGETPSKLARFCECYDNEDERHD